jgi:hypothetical protein
MSFFFSLLSSLFTDKRLTAVILLIWLSIVLVVFSCLGVLQSHFFRFGPSPSLHFMTIPIDTMEEWLLLALYCCVDTLVKSFGHDSIVPWLTHTISDPKCKTLPYRRTVCLLIMEVYFCYVHISSMFKFFLSLAQVDFVLINALSDMAMKILSYSSFMHDKTVVVVVTADGSHNALIEVVDKEDESCNNNINKNNSNKK